MITTLFKNSGPNKIIKLFVFTLIVLFSTEAQVSSRVTHISLEAMIERSDFIIVAQRVKDTKDQTLHDIQEILFVREGEKEGSEMKEEERGEGEGERESEREL